MSNIPSIDDIHAFLYKGGLNLKTLTDMARTEAVYSFNIYQFNFNNYSINLTLEDMFKVALQVVLERAKASDTDFVSLVKRLENAASSSYIAEIYNKGANWTDRMGKKPKVTLPLERIGALGFYLVTYEPDLFMEVLKYYEPVSAES